ncbi:MAG: biotin transporter BioY [Methanosarcinaceae archaeon]|nr:biotin transporter BioY [Methanosarcinaceae archaeon]
MALASLFAALVSVGAYARIPVPFSPVPITLQVFFIFLAAAMLGARWGTLSVIVYLLLGIIGLPVFSGGSSGLGILLGPTGGYLVGFVMAAFLIGILSGKKGTSSVLLNAMFMLAGLCIIYVAGISFLAYAAGITFENAIRLGVLPFLPADLLKVVLASVIASKYSI